MTDLLDLLREQEHEVDPRAEWVHVTMATMAYVCGGSILGLADGGPRGRSTLGWDDNNPPTCPACREPGHRAVSRAIHLQQMPAGHVCSEPDDPDPIHPGCRHWQTIPEEKR